MRCISFDLCAAIRSGGGGEMSDCPQLTIYAASDYFLRAQRPVGAGDTINLDGLNLFQLQAAHANSSALRFVKVV
jgi:hypothetical protein